MLSVELSDIISYVDDAPVTSKTVYSFSADMDSGKLYLLGELSIFKVMDSLKNISVFGSDRGKTNIQVWGQLYKISGSTFAVYE